MISTTPGDGFHGVPCYWCYYRFLDKRRTGKSFPLTPAGKAEAVAFAQAVIEEQNRPTIVERPRLTVDQLWEKFLGERSRGWRPNTRRIYREAWGLFANFIGPHTIAQSVGRRA